MEKMKFSKIRNILLCVLVVFACLLVYPLHKKLTDYVHSSAENFKSSMEEKIGLKISYTGLSPSILSTIYISGINVTSWDDEEILSVNKTKISFNIFKLLKGNVQEGISNITIDGINLDVDQLINFIDYISSRFKGNNEQTFDVSTLSEYIPGKIKFKNIAVHYKNRELNTTFLVKEISLNNNPKNKALSFDLDSKANLMISGIKKEFSCVFDAAGTLYENLDNSNISLKFLNLTDGTYRLNKLALLATYDDNVFSAHTIQAANPIEVSAEYNLKTMLAEARIRTENFSPAELLTTNSIQATKVLKQLKQLYIDTDSSFKISLNDLKKVQFDYASAGKISVPENLFPSGVEVEYSLSGNEKQIEISKITADGKNCNLDGQLSLIYKTLQASGFVELPYFVLPNGKQIYTEIYLDALSKGFMLFSPQTYIGDKALTAIQLSLIPEQDSYDFVLEASDYSHFENGEPGVLHLDGSYLLKSQYLQTSASLTSFFADSILDFGIEAVSDKIKQTLLNVKSFAEPYVISADAYFSTNFQTFSFNIPYLLLANSQGANQVLMVSANGNNDSVQINQLSVVYDKMAVSASGSLDINNETKDMFYTVDFNSSSIPYHFSGSIMKEVITLSGDYSADGEIRFSKDQAVTGHLLFENLPFSYGKQSFVFTLDSDFNYNKENGPAVNINRFSLEDLNSQYSISPKLNVSGTINRYGAQLSSIGYTDFYSSLVGSADVTVNINNSLFDSAGLNLVLKNPLSEEFVSLDASVSNPDGLALNADTIKKSLYLSAQLQVNQFSLNRFTAASNSANILTAVASASGTLEHPFVALSVENANLLMGTAFLNIKGNAAMEDKELSVSDFKVSYAGLNFSDIQAEADLENYTARATCNFETKIGKKNLIVPIEAVLSDSVPAKKGLVPESFVLNAASKKVSGTLLKKPFSFGFTLLYSNNGFTILSTENVGFTGNSSEDGSFNGVLQNPFAKAELSGDFNKSDSNFRISNIDVNLVSLFENINADEWFKMENGSLTGDFAITGNMDDPDYEGTLRINNPDLKLPFLFDKNLSSKEIVVQGISNEIHVVDAVYRLSEVDKLVAGLDLSFNKGALNQMQARLKSYKKELFPMKMKLPWLKIGGEFSCNMGLNWIMDENRMEVTGHLFCENLDAASNFSYITSNTSGKDDSDADSSTSAEPLAVYTDIELTLGTHTSLTFDPLLRCVFVPNTKVKIQIDSAASLYNIDGQIKLKAGDIAYLNRSFYIKSGSIKLNPQNLANPQITFNAETRERDDKGQNVKIMLSAENQYLLDLSPKLSSSPAKSELELQSLLGQIVTADSENASNFLFAAGDYAVQSLLFRQTENKLRDLLNFDIFSLRTNVLQNALNFSVTNDYTQKNLFGNLFDNSTVYIGKYLGSSLYFDAMFQVSYDDRFMRNRGMNNSIYPKPDIWSMFGLELGLELESPLGNIRWNFTPDFESLKNNQFVPSTSVSLLWKFTF